MDSCLNREACFTVTDTDTPTFTLSLWMIVVIIIGTLCIVTGVGCISVVALAGCRRRKDDHHPEREPPIVNLVYRPDPDNPEAHYANPIIDNLLVFENDIV